MILTDDPFHFFCCLKTFLLSLDNHSQKVLLPAAYQKIALLRNISSGQLKEFRSKPKEGIKNPAISAENRKQPKEGILA